MPVLFIGHGSPMNAITDNPYRQAWAELGARFGSDLPRPQMILCVSAHWLTHGWWLTGQARPSTIHDFGGFPQALFDQQYPAPGWPEAAAEIAAGLQAHGTPASVDAKEWGYDHGSWGVLKPMFPAADIPVLQLSLNWDAPPADHLAMGRLLRPLRDRGVLVVASGMVVHNLRAMRRELPDDQVARWLEAGDLEALAGFGSLGELARLAHPTYEHFLPLLHAAGATQPGEVPRFFNTCYQGASTALRCVAWGEA